VSANDLYDVLGVGRDAAVGAIRKAYRSAAKKAHPDTGGSEEKFAALTQAYDCLIDPARRKRYDETGEISDADPDTAEAKAMNVAFGKLSEVLTAIEQRGSVFGEFDVLGDAVKKLRADLAGIDQKTHALKQTAHKLRKLAEKFEAKKGKSNRLRPMLVAQAVDAERHVAAMAADRATVLAAIAVLEDHEFEHQAGGAVYPTGCKTGWIDWGEFR
jgi:DnaJ-class molecular chaperone